jgi:hypothetical protein
MTDRQFTVIVWTLCAVSAAALVGVLLSVGAAPSVAPLYDSSRSQEQPRVTADQVEGARSLLENAKGLATFDEDNDTIEVRFNYGVLTSLDRERVHQLVSGIANADAAVKGRPRRIDFYDPTGARIAVASPLSGIRLTQ